ncbi:MAG: hypothetical protein RRY41_11185 [Burkholderiaceae bacterium]
MAKAARSKWNLTHPQERLVDQYLKEFVFQWLGVVAATLCAVIIAAFCSMPLTLGSHPGDIINRIDASPMHMT